MSEVETIDAAQLAEWEAEFEAVRRRPLPIRVRYGFIKTHMPVLDHEPFR